MSVTSSPVMTKMSPDMANFSPRINEVRRQKKKPVVENHGLEIIHVESNSWLKKFFNKG